MTEPEHPRPPEELGFTGCLDELDRIVRGLETDTVDVDRLAQTVTRAADLVEWCRGRLGDTRIRLEQVLPRLELADDDDDGERGAAGEADTQEAP